MEKGRATAAAEAAEKLKQGIAELVGAGLSHHQAGRLKEAETVYRKVLELDPNQPDALHLLGLLAQQTGHNERAVELIGRAVAIRPEAAEFHSNKGCALQNLGRFEDAVACFEKALALKPGYVDALYNLGSTRLFQGKLEQAAALFERAIAGDPKYFQAYLNLGNVRASEGRYEEAARNFGKVIELVPVFAPAHNNLANALKHLGRIAAAEESLKKSIELDPGYAEAYDNLGLLCLREGRFVEAEANFRRTLALKPGSAAALNNLGVCYRDQGMLEKAVECYDRAFALAPEYGETRWNRAIAWLLAGDLERGWPEYEWRWKRSDFAAIKPEFPLPAWDGGPLAGRTIFVSSEQGIGDTIQFVRYAPVLADRGARVLFGCQPELLTVLAGVRGIAALVPIGGAIPPFDTYASLLSVPGLCRTTLATIPAEVPYIRAEPERVGRWAERLRPLTGLRVGIAWRGNPKHLNDHNRSCPARFFRPLLAVPGVSAVSLQKEATAGEIQELAGALDLAPELADFADTAAAIENLDLVIAVDTAAVHLAGALAKPVWVLLAYAPDWRWMLAREDGPWYPSARLFRQAKPRDWPELMARVAVELARTAGERGKDASGRRSG